MSDKLSVLQPGEVAEILKVTEEAVLAEFEAGRLKGFRIGGEWRTTEQFVLEMITSPTNVPTGDSSQKLSSSVPFSAGSHRKGVPPMSYFQAMSWQQIDGFDYQWPHKAAEAPGTNLESYDEAYQSVITLNNQEVPFVIALCDRAAAGMPDRRRAVVFKGRAGHTLYPITEFTGSNDFAETGKMASIIRLEGRKPVRPGDALPHGYEDMPTGVYNEIVVGPRAWHALAVVAHKTDFPVMVRHAVLRMND